MDRWVQDCSSSEVVTDGLSAENNQSNALASSIECGNYCQARDDFSLQDLLSYVASNSILSCGVQPIEGVDSTVDQNLTQDVKPLEGGCSFVIRLNELFNQFICFNTIVNPPLQGFRISVQNSVQSALSWFISLAVFSQCVLRIICQSGVYSGSLLL